MNTFCCDDLRRARLKGSAFNGIDYLEVLDRDAPDDAQRQRVLLVHWINPLTVPLAPDQVRIEGGERIANVRVLGLEPREAGRVLAVAVEPPGDFSTYTLRLVRGPRSDDPPENFDPLFAAIDFSFKVECPADFDCRQPRICPVEPQTVPDIDYLAKDYGTFRRLMLDRMALLMPEWRERTPADLGIALVELLAYAADHLSYQQDAIATEAYLGTARRRVSVRRHARLVDYFMHDGGNARAWLTVTIGGTDHLVLPAHTVVLSRLPNQPRRLAPDALTPLLREAPVVFETMRDGWLCEAHNELRFHTWGNERCCLPRGATGATLRDDPRRRLRLCVGDVLIFEERLGPNTGLAADADPRRRHAVRLTRVQPEAAREFDAAGREINRAAGPLLRDELLGVGIVHIEWAVADALPLPFCLSTVTDAEHGSRLLGDVSVACGNIVPADQGQSLPAEPLGTVPRPVRFRPAPAGDDRCAPRERIAMPARFRPALSQQPLTFAAPLADSASATALMHWAHRDLLPCIRVASDLDGEHLEWTPRRDLLGSDANDAHFVVEIEHDGSTTLRFGDGAHGRRPEPDMSFTAAYRIGNGLAGNVGAEALWHVVSNDSGITAVRNPLAARGGLGPETVEEARQSAPYAFRTQERAVTAADYAAVAERDPRVQRAAATLRWTGSWHTVFVTVDPLGGGPVDAALDAQLLAQIDRFRMAGHDLEIDGPVFVPLELEMHVCVRPDAFRADVRQTLLELFSNRIQPDGRRGLFHPDHFSFGEPVYLSRLYAAAQAVAGVASVHITTFRRRGAVDNSAIDTGVLRFGRIEIAQLDNDPNFAERGVFKLTLGGGK